MLISYGGLLQFACAPENNSMEMYHDCQMYFFGMLCQCLMLCMQVDPQGVGLKVKDPNKYNFDPESLLLQICEVHALPLPDCMLCLHASFCCHSDSLLPSPGRLGCPKPADVE